jgi:TatD DNase family protein
MNPYINIHTHHLSEDHGVFVFNIRFAHDTPYHTEVLFSAGVHPWDVALLKQTWLDDLKAVVIHPNCLAIGECGLDNLQGADMLLQKTVFRLQLDLAVDCQKPVIIHCVKAFDTLIELSKPYAHKVPLIIHGFHKSSQMAAQLIHNGFYLSLNPAVLKRKDFDFTVIPADRLFLETDMLQNDSIKEVYADAAQCFNTTVDELKERINLNFENLKSQ